MATCLCYQVSCATSSSRGGGSLSCPGHSNPLPSEPVGSRKTLSLGESHSAIVTPCPSPQALPSSTSLWGAHSLTQGFFLWQLCRSKEEALGELILCQAALAVALISSWKSLGLAEDSATDKSWSPDLSPASLITPGPLKYLGASSFLSR